MKVVIIDVWGDGEGCLWAEDSSQLDVMVEEWLALYGVRLLQARVIIQGS